jgi:hypothetical protein
MPVDVASILDDPNWMFLRFDGDFAEFVFMTREACRESIFFDHRVRPVQGKAVRLPIDPIFDHLERTAFKPPEIRFIHHFAQSGSTLLARALDQPNNLVIREPLHLRQVGVWAGADTAGPLSAQTRPLLELSLAMLGKRFKAGSPLIVKGNVPITLLADAIADLDPGQPAILLYYGLEDYCLAVLRTPNHQQWLANVVDEIGLGGDEAVGKLAGLSMAEKAGALWLSMIRRFDRLLQAQPAMRSLDANVFFERPAEAIVAASTLFDAGISAGEARRIAEGPLFSTYSKDPGVPYDPALRIERREEARKRLAAELQEARSWVDRRVAADVLPARLERPLAGETAALF